LAQEPSPSATVGAVILAGGQARRMGGTDKGLVKLQGRPMAAWVLSVLAPESDCVVINANRNSAAYASLGVSVVSDDIADFPGPLAGLLSASEALTTDWVLMCPCDSPFISTDLIRALIAAARSQHPATITVAHDGERLQPVFALVPRSARHALRAYLQRGERKIDRWYEEMGFQVVDCAQFRALFNNINTPEERDAAEQQIELLSR